MSSKRAANMSKINNFATTSIKDTTNPDDAVAAFLGKPIPSTAPGTQPTVTKTTTIANVGGVEDSDTTTQEGPSYLSKSVDQIVGVGQGLASRTYQRLQSTPIPGGIGVPLTILFVLFLILLPVNGHTRLMWLWLSLTHQAEIGAPLTPPTQIAASSTGTAAPTNYSDSSGGNPNQTGTATNTTQLASATKITQSSVKNTTVHTNTSKTHGTTAKGGGPGPGNPAYLDPTAPKNQASYVNLFVHRSGYE